MIKIAEQRAGQGCAEKEPAHLSARALSVQIITNNKSIIR